MKKDGLGDRLHREKALGLVSQYESMLKNNESHFYYGLVFLQVFLHKLRKYFRHYLPKKWYNSSTSFGVF